MRTVRICLAELIAQKFGEGDVASPFFFGYHIFISLSNSKLHIHIQNLYLCGKNERYVRIEQALKRSNLF